MPTATRKAPKNKMISIETLVIASVVVTLGWFTGKMITSFVDFVVEYNRKHNRGTEMTDWVEVVAIAGIATSLVVVAYGLAML